MYEGRTFNIGGQEWVVPALSLATLRRFSKEDILGKLGSIEGNVFGEAQVDAAVQVIHAALVRNYPGVTPEQVAEMVDLGNFREMVRAIFGQSGVETVPAGEGGSP